MEDLSDNEREEQLRAWWSENWLWIVGGVALGLALLAGWQYWQKSRLASAELDESAYSAVLSALGNNQRDAAIQQADNLRTQHPKSPYADQSDLALAHFLVDARDFDGAAKRLRVVADSSRDPELKAIARTRLARVLIEQHKFDDALALLDVAQAGSFAPLYHEIRGDALAGKGDLVAARQEYDTAIAAMANDPNARSDRSYLELKRDALPAAGAPPAAPAAPGTPGTQP